MLFSLVCVNKTITFHPCPFKNLFMKFFYYNDKKVNYPIFFCFRFLYIFWRVLLIFWKFWQLWHNNILEIVGILFFYFMRYKIVYEINGRKSFRRKINSLYKLYRNAFFKVARKWFLMEYKVREFVIRKLSYWK